MRYFCLILSLILGLSTSVSADSTENYLCIEEASTGFHFENGGWKSSKFKEYKFLVKVEKGSTYNKDVTITKFGDESPTFFPENCKVYATNIRCASVFGQFKMGTRDDNLNFLNAYTYGFVEKNYDTPTIGIGSCAKM